MVRVFFGSAERDQGVRRVLKARRHETPGADGLAGGAAGRLGIASLMNGGPAAVVFKTLHAGHTGKLSFARVFGGDIAEGATVGGVRVGGLLRVPGGRQEKTPKAAAGAVVALARTDGPATGQCLAGAGVRAVPNWPATLAPLFAMAIHADKREDDVKLTGALAKLIEEDPSLSFGPNPDTGEFLLWGQGEMHLQIALDRLKQRLHVSVKAKRPQVPTGNHPKASSHARHRSNPAATADSATFTSRSSCAARVGFAFDNSITGGVLNHPGVGRIAPSLARPGRSGFPWSIP